MSNDNPFLNETGRTNMGELSAISHNQSNIVNILGADGKVKSSDDETKEEAAKALAKSLIEKDGVTWHKDDQASEENGKDMFFPRLSIKGLAEKFGVSRPHKEFFPNERNLFIQAFMNDCAEYLFNVPAFNEIDTNDGVAFRPNKEWVNLPVKK